jgi:ribosomal protein L40E
MAKKTLGYTELQWTCPNCSAINPGPEKTCTQCGAPQPEEVEFEQVKGAELIQDQAVKARVEAGADIHCPYCGARNRGDAQVCSQCGGDLVEGTRRQRGEVLGAYKAQAVEKVPCPHCGAENPETAKACSQCGGSMHVEDHAQPSKEPARPSPIPAARPKKKGPPTVLIVALVLVCFLAAILVFLSMRTEAVAGTVDSVGWERSIQIEGLVPVEHRDWRDQVPVEGEILSCAQEVRSIESEPQPNADEVCGTPYNVDTGSGYAEVVLDCEYHVYDDFCTYSVLEWAVVDTASLTGAGFSAEWPDPVLSAEERPGAQEEKYLVVFETNQGEYTYSLKDFDRFQQFQIGSQWDLEVNALGGVVSVSP